MEYSGCIWSTIKYEARLSIKHDEVLSNYYNNSILLHSSLEVSLANQLTMKLSISSFSTVELKEIFLTTFKEDVNIERDIQEDLKAIRAQDPVCISYKQILLNFKSFLACEAYRASHKLWMQGRKDLTLLIQNRISEIFNVDIHPTAKIGYGILFDHTTSLVIGEMTIIGNNVTILHNVTLGGTSKICGGGVRHPKIGDRVSIGADASILGNIMIGEGAKIGVGSIVLKDVSPKTTVVGNPTKLIGDKA